MNENMEDAYQAMKFAGEEIDILEQQIKNNQVDFNSGVRYWDLNNLWWDAAAIYVPKKRLQSMFSMN